MAHTRPLDSAPQAAIREGRPGSWRDVATILRRLASPGHLAWAAACLVLLLLAAIATTRSVGTQIPGVVVTSTLIVGNESSGDRLPQGILGDDVLVALAGTPVSSRAELQRQLAMTRGPVSVTVRRGAATTIVSVRPRPLGWRDLLDVNAEILLVGLAFLGLGTACLWARPADPAARGLFWFTSITAGYQASRILLLVGDIPGPLPNLLLAASGSAALQMSLAFPAPPAWVSSRRWLVPALYLPIAALATVQVAVWQPYGLIRSGTDAMWHQTLLALGSYWTLCAGLSALAILAVRALRSSSERVREHTRIALLGAGVAFGPAIALSLFPAMLGMQADAVGEAICVLFAPFFPAAVAYAVLRKDLFDLEWAVRRIATYVLVSTVLALAYYALTILLQRALRWEAAANLVATFILVVAFAPVRDRFQAVVDRIFHRVPYDFRQVATEFARQCREVTAIDDLVDLFRRAVEAALHPSWIDIRIPAHATSQPGEPSFAASKLGNTSRATTKLGEPPALAVELRSGQEVYGSVAIGAKLSGQDYAREDRDLLDLLGQNMALGIRNIQLIRQVADQERLRREIEIAAEVQNGMMPRSLPEIAGFSTSVMYRPALEVAGDFFDLVPLPGGRWGAVVGDVSGKGVPAALLAGVCLTLFRAIAPEAGGAIQTMNRVNHQLRRYRPKATMFVCAAYMELDPATGAVEIVNAGLPSPWFSGERLAIKGRPLGFSEKSTYEGMAFSLQPGETLVCYTDGLEDARDPGGRALGSEGVTRILAGDTGSQGLEALGSALDEHLDGMAPFDDITVLFVRRDPS